MEEQEEAEEQDMTTHHLPQTAEMVEPTVVVEAEEAIVTLPLHSPLVLAEMVAPTVVAEAEELEQRAVINQAAQEAPAEHMAGLAAAD